MTLRFPLPPTIAVCQIEGDWIEWTKDTPPEEGDCPFTCRCTPVLYVRFDHRLSSPLTEEEADVLAEQVADRFRSTGAPE